MIDFFSQYPHWKQILEVSEALNSKGYCAYLAGGSVRDALLGRVPHDFDIATNASPDEVQAIFPRNVSVGKSFGVIVIPFTGFQVEIATFRKDGEYHDGRHPDQVVFSSAEEDALRRDFTVNAMFYDINERRLLDYVHGETDLKNQMIRAVGNPEQRFAEDKLRLLRAIRFAAQLNFTIEESTLAAIKSKSADIIQVSKERIRDEIIKVLKSPQPDLGFQLLIQTQLAPVLFPEFNEEIWQELIQLWSQMSNKVKKEDMPTELLISLFLLPWAQRLPEDGFQANGIWHSGVVKQKLLYQMLEKWKLARNQAELIVMTLLDWNLQEHMSALRLGFLRRRLSGIGGQLLRQGYKLAGVSIHLPCEEESELPPALFMGRDILALGVTPGPQVKSLLDEIYMLQLEGQIQDFAGASKMAQSLLAGTPTSSRSSAIHQLPLIAGKYYLPSTWLRLFARFIDSVCVNIPTLILILPQLKSIVIGNPLYFSWFSIVILILFNLSYDSLFLKFLGATPGKWILGLRVISYYTESEKLLWVQVIIRTLFNQLSFFLSLAPQATAFYSLKRRHIGDWLAETQVVQLTARRKPPQKRNIMGTILMIFFFIYGLLSALQMSREFQVIPGGVQLKMKR